jgi:hypothetical protein
MSTGRCAARSSGACWGRRRGRRRRRRRRERGGGEEKEKEEGEEEDGEGGSGGGGMQAHTWIQAITDSNTFSSFGTVIVSLAIRAATYRTSRRGRRGRRRVGRGGGGGWELKGGEKKKVFRPPAPA